MADREMTPPARLRWTREAVASLREIHDHIARDRPETAVRTVESILHKAESLLANPPAALGTREQDGHQVHMVSYGRFRIAYTASGPGIVILGVFHGLIFLPLT